MGLNKLTIIKVVVVVIIIGFIILVGLAIRRRRKNKLKSKEADKVIEGAGGDEATDIITRAIKLSEESLKNNNDPLTQIRDTYRLGRLYQFYIKDEDTANKYYNETAVKIDEYLNDDEPEIVEVNNILFDLHNYDLDDDINPIEQKMIDKAVKPVKQDENDVIKTSTKNFYKEMSQYSNDNQNVHDTNVNNDIKSIYESIVQTNQEDAQDPDQLPIYPINDYVNKNPFNFDQGKLNKIQNALSAMRNNKYRVQPMNVREEDILNQTWIRIHSPDNKDNHENLKLAFFNGLEDCTENNHLVCSNGRIARVVGSLSILDKFELRTKEMLRNAIYAKAGQIVQQEVENLKNKDENLYKRYIDSDQSNDVVNFESGIKDKIVNMIKNEYITFFNDDELSTVTQSALAGV